MSKIETCNEAVIRKGELEPCDNYAIAMRYDRDNHDIYPVCVKHCYGDMIPLNELKAAAWEEGAFTVYQGNDLVAGYLPENPYGVALIKGEQK